MNIADFLPGIGTDDLIIGMAGISAVMATAAAWYGLVDHNPGARRARELAASRVGATPSRRCVRISSLRWLACYRSRVGS